MTTSSRGIAFIFGILALVLSGAALAQESLDKGKSPAQLYEADCAICHKITRGLSRAGGVLGLESFLREHYTASRESAAAIANYLRQVDRGPLPADHKRSARPKRDERNKPADKEKSAEKKSAKPGAAEATDKKPGEAKPGEKKAGEPKAADKKTDETKATDKKSDKKKGEPKATHKKPGETKSTSSKPSKPKATDAEAKAAKPAAATSDKPTDAKPAE